MSITIVTWRPKQNFNWEHACESTPRTPWTVSLTVISPQSCYFIGCEVNSFCHSFFFLLLRFYSTCVELLAGSLLSCPGLVLFWISFDHTVWSALITMYTRWFEHLSPFCFCFHCRALCSKCWCAKPARVKPSQNSTQLNKKDVASKQLHSINWPTAFTEEICITSKAWF